MGRTKSIVNLGLHFDPDYTTEKFYDCILQCCDAITLVNLDRQLPIGGPMSTACNYDTPVKYYQLVSLLLVIRCNHVGQTKPGVTHLEKRSAMALFFPLPLSDSSFAVTRKDCVAHDRRLNGPLSISGSYLNTCNENTATISDVHDTYNSVWNAPNTA